MFRSIVTKNLSGIESRSKDDERLVGSSTSQSSNSGQDIKKLNVLFRQTSLQISYFHFINGGQQIDTDDRERE